MQFLFTVAFIFGVAGLLSASASAQCPEGKSEIVVQTPSGVVKTLCVGDQAVEGLENAADHSEGTIIPASCPCFTQDDVVATLDANADFLCPLAPGTTSSGADCSITQCFDSDATFFLLFLAVEGPEERGNCNLPVGGSFGATNGCGNSSGNMFPLTAEEGDACRALLEPFAGLDSAGDGFPGVDDNCPNDFSPDQADADGDGVGDVCDTD
jgi:hypothetical protein